MAGKVQSNNYIVVQGWMVSRLQLKGGELLTYAIIYGFSQAEDQGYTGTIQYLSEWTGSSRQSVINWLKALVEKGLIERREYMVNNVKFVDYRSKILTGVVKNFDGGSQNFLPEPVKNFDTDNTKDNIDDNSIDRESARPRTRTRESEKPDEGEKDESGEDPEPSLEEVKKYIKEHKLKVDAVAFVKYYESIGVRLGGYKLKSWKARLELWDRREQLGEDGSGKSGKRKGPKNGDISYFGGSFDVDDFWQATLKKSYGDLYDKNPQYFSTDNLTSKDSREEEAEADAVLNQLKAAVMT